MAPVSASITSARSALVADTMSLVPSGEIVAWSLLNPSTCVRFDVHAVYLGHPGADMACPAGIIGRGGLGTGLGAVLRLADHFECRQDEAGKEITVLFHREPVSKRRRT